MVGKRLDQNCPGKGVGMDGHDSMLLYAVQMFTPAFLLARIAGKEIVGLDEVEEVGELFMDAKTSAQRLLQDEAFYLH